MDISTSTLDHRPNHHAEATIAPVENTHLMSISSLPIEILQIVFLIVVEDAYRLLPNIEVVQSMLHLTHVCNLWRSIALNFPRMWFPVVVSGRVAELSDVFFERGRSTPLRLSHPWDEEPQIPSKLTDHRGRLEEICLFTSTVESAAILRNIGQDFPTLIRLIIHGNIDSVGNPSLDDALITVNGPKVQHLFLIAVRIADLSTFRNLTHLELIQVQGPAISVENIIFLLSRSPNLRYLKLGYFSKLAEVSRTDRTVNLLHLRKLTLCLSRETVAFCSILFPFAGPGTKVRVDFRFEDDLIHREILELASRNIWILQNKHELSCELYDGMFHFQTRPKSRASFKFSVPRNLEHYFPSIPVDLCLITSLTICTVNHKHSDILSRLPHLRRLAIYDIDEQTGFHKNYINSLVCTQLEVLIIIGPEYNDPGMLLPNGKLNPGPWIEIMRHRVRSGCVRLKSFVFLLLKPEDYPLTDYSWEEVTESLVFSDGNNLGPYPAGWRFWE